MPSISATIELSVNADGRDEETLRRFVSSLGRHLQADTYTAGKLFAGVQVRSVSSQDAALTVRK